MVFFDSANSSHFTATDDITTASPALSIFQIFVSLQIKFRRALSASSPASDSNSTEVFDSHREEFEDLAYKQVRRSISRKHSFALPAVLDHAGTDSSVNHDKGKPLQPDLSYDHASSQDVDIINSSPPSPPPLSALLAPAIRRLEKQVKHQGIPLQQIAAHDQLFLDAQPDWVFRELTLIGALQGLSLTNATLESLDRLVKQRRADSVGGAGTRHASDTLEQAKYVANLEHLLLRIRGALLDFLVRKSIEAVEQQVQASRNSNSHGHAGDTDWFSEWPSGRRPLSTCWPWNIRPSLVVLWGVCWKFFGNDFDRQMAAYAGDTANVRVPREALTTQEFWDIFPRQPPSALTYADFASESLNLNDQASHHVISRTEREPSPDPHLHHQATEHEPPRVDAHGFDPHHHHLIGAGPDHGHLQPTYLPSDWESVFNWPSTPLDGQFSQPWLPGTAPAFQGQEQAPPPPSQSFETSALSAGIRTEHLRSRLTRLIPPPHIEILPPSAPNTATDIYNASPVSFPSNGHPDLSFSSTPIDMPHDVQASFPSPVSPNCTPGPPDPLPPEANTPTFPDRRGPAPRNADGRMICTWPECAELTFNRRCEWTKHMDKHERPYKCKEKGCEHVRGFTYSGGLLRHEREVHSKHGGPRVVYCQHRDCKRSSGRGFTRRENLVEHMHRMHGIDADAIEPDVGSSSSAARKPRKRKRSEDVGSDAALSTPASGKARASTQVDAATTSATAVSDADGLNVPADDSSLDARFVYHTPLSIAAARDPPKGSLEMLDRENKRLCVEVREKDDMIKKLSSALANITRFQHQQQNQHQ